MFKRKCDPTLLELPNNVRPRQSTRAKRASLRLNNKEKCIDLIIPKRVSQSYIQRFVAQHHDWITQTLKTLPEPVHFENGVRFPFFGETLTLNIEKDNSFKTTRISKHENILTIQTRLDTSVQRLKRWIIKETRERLETLAQEKAALINETVGDVRVRDTSSRWGSCSHDRNLSFSWRLAFAPMHAIDYVVAHEVAHFVHMNHSPEFWGLCEELCVDYKRGKKWMRENGKSLMKYQFDVLSPERDPK